MRLQLLCSKKFFLVILLSSIAFVAQAEIEPPESAGPRFFLRPCAKSQRLLKSLQLDDFEKEAVADALMDFRDSIEEGRADYKAAAKELLKSVASAEDTLIIEEAFSNYSDALKERVLTNAEFLAAVKEAVDRADYIKILRARVNIFTCVRAPQRIFGRGFKMWIQDRKTANDSGLGEQTE